jgi:hypothetical protein
MSNTVLFITAKNESISSKSYKTSVYLVEELRITIVLFYILLLKKPNWNSRIKVLIDVIKEVDIFLLIFVYVDIKICLLFPGRQTEI